MGKIIIIKIPWAFTVSGIYWNTPFILISLIHNNYVKLWSPLSDKATDSQRLGNLPKVKEANGETGMPGGLDTLNNEMKSMSRQISLNIGSYPGKEKIWQKCSSKNNKNKQTKASHL